MRERLDSLQVCRAIAALLVLIYHFSIESKIFLGHEFLYSFFNFGHAGVTFFFVLSGFIICYAHWKDIDGRFFNFQRYIIKRFVRIFPSYWSVLIFTTLLYLFFGESSMNHHEKITLSSFIPNLFLMSYNHELIVSVAWTLEFEIIFYILFAVFIFNKRFGLIIFTVWLFLIFIYQSTDLMIVNNFYKILFNFYNLQFLMGCLIAYIIKKFPHFIIQPYFLLFIGISGFIGFGYYEDYYNTLNKITNAMIFASFSSVIILALVRLESIKPINCPKTLIFLGGSSYAIYLTHNMLISILFRIVQHVPFHQFPILRFTFLTFFIIGNSIIIACLYYKFYELPLIKIIKNKILFHINKNYVFARQ